MKITKRQLKRLISEQMGDYPRRGTEPSGLAYYHEILDHLESSLHHISMAQDIESRWSRVDPDEDLDEIRISLEGLIDATQAMVAMGS